MVKGSCWTENKDYQNEEWPRSFAQIVQPGDWVESENKRKLKVKSVTHYSLNGEPRIRVELGK